MATSRGIEGVARRTVRAVEGVCADAQDEHELLRSVAERVREAVPYSAGAWLVTEPATGLFTNGHVERFDAAVCEPWFDNELHVEDVNKFQDLVGRAPAILSRTGGKHDSARWNRLMRPHGLDDEMRLTLDDATGCWGTVELHRQVETGPFSPKEAELLDRIAPAVTGGLRRLAVARRAAVTADPHGPGLLHVHRDGTTEAVTEAGAAWLQLLLPPTRPDIRTALMTLASLVLGTDEQPKPRHLRRRAANGRWVTLHAAPMLSSDTVAVIVDPSRPSEVAEVIARAYQLTPREREVAFAVARGATTEELATSLHISVHTVRDHVKSALSKVDVGSRTELAAVLFNRHYAPGLFRDVNVED